MDASKKTKKRSKADLHDHLYRTINASESIPDVTHKQVDAFLDEFIEYVRDNVAGGWQVPLYTLGCFYPKDLPERQARNPRTGETVIAAPSRKIKFRDSTGALERSDVEPDLSHLTMDAMAAAEDAEEGPEEDLDFLEDVE